jgi:hypothetical protein
MTHERLTTTKLAPSALRMVRVVAAHTNERQHEVWTRLIESEAKRLGVRAPKARQAAG